MSRADPRHDQSYRDEEFGEHAADDAHGDGAGGEVDAAGEEGADGEVDDADEEEGEGLECCE